MKKKQFSPKRVIVTVIVVIFVFIALVMGVKLYLKKTDKNAACQNYYMSFTGAGFERPHPPFDCRPYPPEHPIF